MKTMVCQVLLLATNEASRLYKSHIDKEKNILGYTSSDPYYMQNFGGNTQNQHLYFVNNNEPNIEDWVYVNCSEAQIEEIRQIVGKANDQFLFDDESQIHKDYCKKIEATIDSSIKIFGGYGSGETHDEAAIYESLPQIPETFIQAYIKAYNEGNPITEVQIELEDNGEEEWFGDNYNGQPGWLEKWEVKTRKDNTVIIHPIKTYSRSDVEQLCYQAFINHQCIDGKIIPSKALDLIKPFKKWFEENVS